MPTGSDMFLIGASATHSQQKHRALRFARERAWHSLQQFRERIKEDWRGGRAGLLGLVLLLLSSLIVLAYYVNHPDPEVYSDTSEYLAVSHQIMTTGKLVDPMRLPGYPLLISVVFLVTGQGNLAAVSVLQGILFVLSVLEIYIITCIVTHRAWIGFSVGLLVATNTYLLTFIKPILSEGFSLWIVTSLALALVLFVRTLHVRYVWLVATCFFFAFMTRPEWIYGPILFFAFLLLVAGRHGRFRRMAPHVITAVLALYGVLGIYIYENATLNNYAGISIVQRINLFGKVLQYDMQNEAPPQYLTLCQEVDAYRETGAHSPYAFAALYPEVAANNWTLADAYASSIVQQHPLEYGLKTVPIFFNSLTDHYEESQVDVQGPWWQQLYLLKNLSRKVVDLYALFPLLALVWLVGMLWRRTARSRLVEMMGVLSLIGLYELVLTSSGGYEAYARLHSAFNPVLLVVICGSLLLGLVLLARLMMNLPVTGRLAWLWPRIWWAWGGLITGAIVISVALTLLRHGFAALMHLHTWSGLSLAFNHPTLSSAVLGMMGLFTYCIYKAHCLKTSETSLEQEANGLSPGQ